MNPVDVIATGGIVGVPTDTVYGLAVDPRNEDAVLRLYEVKGRPTDNPLALLVADAESADGIVELSPRARELADAHWPGALTIVAVPRQPLPDWVGHPTTRTVGVRVPDHAELRRLLGQTGPLAVTSANLSGESPARSHTEAERVFGRDVRCYVEGRSGGSVASTVVDATGDELVVLRSGPIEISVD